MHTPIGGRKDGRTDARTDRRTDGMTESQKLCPSAFLRKGGGQKAWRASGGIAVLVKESLRNACKIEPVSDSDVVWVRVHKDITKLSRDLYTEPNL